MMTGVAAVADRMKETVGTIAVDMMTVVIVDLPPSRWSGVWGEGYGIFLRRMRAHNGNNE